MKTQQEVKLVTLFETSSTLTEFSTQSHNAHSFFVPDGVTKLHLSFQYAPTMTGTSELLWVIHGYAQKVS